MQNIPDLFNNLRTGTGFDVHAFAPDRDLILGGVKLDYPLGLAGHSDADVLVHAIMDAILGAAGLGDIGRLFPDTDDEWKGADSLKLMERVNLLLREKGGSVISIDSVVICQAPKIAPFTGQMKQKISAVLGLAEDRIGIKGTTTEHLGFTGRKEGIAVQASALVWMDRK